MHMYTPPTTRKEIPQWKQDLLHLMASPAKCDFATHLTQSSTPKVRNANTFKQGVEQFTRIANLPYSQRQAYFGHKFAGVHYNNDLSKHLNQSYPNKNIAAHHVAGIAPTPWEFDVKSAHLTLIYKGDKPSEALDALLKGPTVIDCGIFCQLSIWFGIKNMLGNETFNKIFGKNPFFITQHLYAGITHPNRPSAGNPLFPFFRKENPSVNPDAVYLVHLANHFLYQYKHPGGNYAGENCVVIAGKYTIFDPDLPSKTALSMTDVQALLRETFNEDHNINDRRRMELLQKRPEKLSEKLLVSFKDLIELADSFKEMKFDQEDWIAGVSNPMPGLLCFELDKFLSWVSICENQVVPEISYEHLSDQNIKLSDSLIQQIPEENRTKMSFSQFKVETELQKEMHALSKLFCSKVMRSESVCVNLSGKAGIGKTASAVSCLKELNGRGKHVIWFSEVMVNTWTNKAQSFEDLDDCRNEIKKLLETNPDAVFLDDDNIVDLAGKILLEEIFTWYANHDGKGLFITSNEPITFKGCYGIRMDNTYHCPHFIAYDSPQFLSTYIRNRLTGNTMRDEASAITINMTDNVRLQWLLNIADNSARGVLVEGPVVVRQ
ncbi:MAG: hypothetical protein ACHQAX_10045 [Gammaproteobacteria bacterium]